jgi:hypothetical protein
MNATDLIKLRQLQQSPQCKEKWCKEQQTDIDNICKMAEELIVYAIASTTSSQAYEQLQNARHNFYKTLVDLSEQYRHI